MSDIVYIQNPDHLIKMFQDSDIFTKLIFAAEWTPFVTWKCFCIHEIDTHEPIGTPRAAWQLAKLKVWNGASNAREVAEFERFTELRIATKMDMLIDYTEGATWLEEFI